MSNKRTVLSHPIAVTGLISLLAISCKPGGQNNPKEDDAPNANSPVESIHDEDKNGGEAGTIETGDAGDLDELDPGQTETALIGGSLDVAVVSAGTLAVGNTGLLLTEIGQAGPADLMSLQYRIQSIQICEEMQVNGTGYSNPKNCLIIYNEKNRADYMTFGYNEAKADTENYTDLLDPNSIKNLSSQLNLTMRDAHAYNFGLINWYQPIKVKAAIAIAETPNASTTTVYTKDGPMVTEIIGNDNYNKFVTRVANITTAPAELAIVRHNNGGAWFKFAEPFVITEADITNKVNFKLDLAFNPDAVVKASKGVNGNLNGVPDATFPNLSLDHPTYPANMYSIDVPMLSLTPIAHGVDKHVRKDTYIAHLNEASDKFDFRIEIYSIDGDPKANIYGIDLETLITADSTDPVTRPYDPFFVSVQSDGEIIMQTYDHKAIFSGFKRLAALNDTGTMQYKTGNGLACLATDGNSCYTDPNYAASYTMTYEFKASVVLP